MAEHCQFGLLNNEMIHDYIVVGPADQKSEKLQLGADLALEKAIHSVRQSKSVRSQQSKVRGQEDASQTTKVERVQTQEVSKDITESSRENLQAIDMPKQCKQRCLPKIC